MQAMILLLILTADPPVKEYRIEVRRVYDGDTILADLDLGFATALVNKPIRLAGFDAFEITKRRQTVEVTDEEIEKGLEAKASLAFLLSQYPKRLYLRPEGTGFGVYNRLQGHLIIYPKGDDGPIVISEWMKERNHDRGPRPADAPLSSIPSGTDDDLSFPD